MKTRLRLLFVAAVLLASSMMGSTRVSAYSCEEQVYQDSLTFCWGVALDGRCDFYASQACLCMRSWADCPVCY